MTRALPRTLPTALLLGAGLVLLLAIAPGARANPHGIVGYSEAGCICHAAAPTASVRPVFTGIPEDYRPGETYDIHISVEGGPPADVTKGGHAGGFNLRASAGELEVPAAIAGQDVVIKSFEGGMWHDMTSGHGMSPFPRSTWGELSFGHVGANQRTWTVEWKTPKAGVGDVTFSLAVLSANGDHSNSTADQWNTLTFSTAEGVPLPFLERYAGALAVAAVGVGLVVAIAGGRTYAQRRRDARLPARRRRQR